MPLRPIQFVTGEYYHLFNRGAGRSAIFRTEDDYVSFIDRVKQNARKHAVAVIAYCLIPNHFHLLLRQDSVESAGTMVQYTCNGYAQWFNRRHERSGTLFQGRFRAVHVGRDEYLRHLCRYIHGNPVRHGVALEPALWPYSNYLDWLGLRQSELVDRRFIADHFGSVEQYTRYLIDYLTHSRDIPEKLQQYLLNLEA